MAWHNFIGLHLWQYADKTLVATAFVELHCAVDERIQRVILANTDILAGVVLGAALAHDDVSGDTFLSAPDLNA